MKIVVDPLFSSHEAFIAQIPTLFAERSGCEFIYDKRNTVARFFDGQQTFIVKRFKQPNFIQRVVYSFFRRSKAQRAYLYAEAFQSRGIDTPQRVAYIEQTKGGLFSIGYFVSLEAQGTESHLLLREVKDYDPELAAAVARQVVLMHSRGILHGDLNLSNFLCRTTPDGYRFTMIDINRSQFCDGFPDDDACLRNLVRTTHRRDLYEDLVRRYAVLRHWDADKTVERALQLLDRFENRRFKL